MYIELSVSFAGVGAALLVINLELVLCTLSMAVPLAFTTVAFRRRAVVLYNQARDRIAIVNADFQESLSGVRESQAFVHQDLTDQRFHQLGRDYLNSRWRRSAWWRSTSRGSSCCPGWPASSCSASAPP